MGRSGRALGATTRQGELERIIVTTHWGAAQYHKRATDCRVPEQAPWSISSLICICTTSLSKDSQLLAEKSWSKMPCRWLVTIRTPCTGTPSELYNVYTLFLRFSVVPVGLPLYDVVLYRLRESFKSWATATLMFSVCPVTFALLGPLLD